MVSTDRNILGGAIAFQYHQVYGVESFIKNCTFVDNIAFSGPHIGYAEGVAFLVGCGNGSRVSTKITNCAFIGNAAWAPAMHDGIAKIREKWSGFS